MWITLYVALSWILVGQASCQDSGYMSNVLEIEPFKDEQAIVEDHYVEIPNFYQPDNPGDKVTALSICIRYKVNMLVEQFLFSAKEVKSLFVLKIKDTNVGTMFVGMNGKTYMNVVPMTSKILPAKWNHFCASYHPEGRLLPVYNGILLHDDITGLKPLNMAARDFANITLVLGYDHFGNQKNKLLRNVFHGEITELYIAFDKLTLTEMVGITKDCKRASNVMKNIIFNWDNSNFNVNDKTITTIDRRQSICKTSVGIKMGDILFPYQVTVPEAAETCSAFGGHLLSPKDLTEAKALVKKFDATNPGTMQGICNSYVVTGIVQGSNISDWVDINTGTAPKFEIPWQPGQPNGRHIDKCTRFRLSKGTYSDVGCKSTSQCFTCRMKTGNVFHLRGLNEELSQVVDSSYSIIVNGNLMLLLM